MMMKEPSVLDYLKAKLTPWRGPAPEIPPLESLAADSLGEDAPTSQESAETAGILRPESSSGAVSNTAAPSREARLFTGRWPWRTLIGLGLACLAQASLAPRPERDFLPGLFLYGVALTWIIWAAQQGEFRLAPLPDDETISDPLTVKLYWLIAGAVLTVFAFLALGGNRFTTTNVILWLGGLAGITGAFWLTSPEGLPWYTRLANFWQSSKWQLKISRFTLVLFLAGVVVIFFRTYRITEVPPEMVSDHAEKLWDVWDVLNGQTSIFFPRNTGREGLQMYLTAGIVRWLGTGYSFLSLKIGTVLAGLLTLPFVYLLGKDYANRRVGLLAFFLAGVAYWPNVISRVGLRFPFYPLFVAPTLYYFLRGLRRGSRNDFILAGLAMGIGLHGYTPIRILPVVVLVGVGLYLLHRHSQGNRKQTIWMLILLAIVAFVAFLPLMRYAIENPEGFVFRSFSRVGALERDIPGQPLLIFIQNLWRGMAMFAWDDGEIWVTSVTHRPALDLVAGALFYLGIAVLGWRYLRQRHWQDLFLLLSVPLLLMPSILSLAFPAENPSLNRMGGAIVTVFIIIALALDGIMRALERGFPDRLGKRFAIGLAGLLLLFSGLQNYQLVFEDYQQAYLNSSWNTSEMGQVILDFSNSIGSADTAWVLAFPHWVDTRLVGIHANQPQRDYAIDIDQISATHALPGSKLFLVKPDDEEGLQTLLREYPEGIIQLFDSRVENHDFYIFFAPAVP